MKASSTNKQKPARMDAQKVTLAARIDEGEYEAPKSSPRTADINPPRSKGTSSPLDELEAQVAACYTADLASFVFLHRRRQQPAKWSAAEHSSGVPSHTKSREPPLDEEPPNGDSSPAWGLGGLSPSPLYDATTDPSPTMPTACRQELLSPLVVSAPSPSPQAEDDQGVRQADQDQPVAPEKTMPTESVVHNLLLYRHLYESRRAALAIQPTANHPSPPQSLPSTTNVPITGDVSCGDNANDAPESTRLDWCVEGVASSSGVVFGPIYVGVEDLCTDDSEEEEERPGTTISTGRALPPPPPFPTSLTTSRTNPTPPANALPTLASAAPPATPPNDVVVRRLSFNDDTDFLGSQCHEAAPTSFDVQHLSGGHLVDVQPLGSSDSAGFDDEEEWAVAEGQRLAGEAVLVETQEASQMPEQHSVSPFSVSPLLDPTTWLFEPEVQYGSIDRFRDWQREQHLLRQLRCSVDNRRFSIVNRCGRVISFPVIQRGSDYISSFRSSQADGNDDDLSADPEVELRWAARVNVFEDWCPPTSL